MKKHFALSLLALGLASSQVAALDGVKAKNVTSGSTKPNALINIEPQKRYIVSFYNNKSLNNPALTDSITVDTSFKHKAFVNGKFSAPNARKLVASAGGNVMRELPSVSAIAAELTGAQLKSLRNNPEVYFIEEDPVRTLHGEESPYGIAQVQADLMSEAAINNQKVCVIDTGVEAGHEDLAGIANMTGEVSNTLTSPVDLGVWNQDSYGHGTHVTGILSAIGNNNIGVRGVSASGNLNLHIVKIIHNPNYYRFYASDMIAGINACQQAGANIVNMSIGGENSSVTEQTAMDNARAAGMLLFGAAGNRGSISYFYPASYDSVVSVGAVDSENSPWMYTQTNDQVELVAPGVGIKSTLPNNSYSNWDGTSMATPFAAGVAALVWSQHSTCSNNQVREALQQSALDLGDAGLDTTFGYGLVQAQAASDYLTANGCPVDEPPPAQDAVFTDPEDFEEGDLYNVEVTPDGEVVLQDTPSAFDVIWIAASGRGTIVKINTVTGDILGEYLTAPDGHGKNPSRTTVDGDGSVWATNRADTVNNQGSVVHIGSLENNQCVDRNNNGIIETSTGLGDIKSWSNAGGVDSDGGVDTAQDECIIHFTKVHSTKTRHVSVTPENDVWVSGTDSRVFNLVDGDTGLVKRTEGPVGYGGYGGILDGNGILWSSRRLLRWDISKPLSGDNHGPDWQGYEHDSYGICIDSLGNVWNTSLNGDEIRKYAPDGKLLGTYNHGNSRAQGCAIDHNDKVWVAHSLGGRVDVGHLTKDGEFLGNVSLEGHAGPTGIAIDKLGKVWVTAWDTHAALRIDPSLGELGKYGIPLGKVDLIVPLGGGASPYNYSDMTGSVQPVIPDSGTLNLDYDSGPANNVAGGDNLLNDRDTIISWNGTTPGDSTISITAVSSADGINYGLRESVINGQKLTVATDRYIRLYIHMTRSTTTSDANGLGHSPALADLTISRVDNNQGN